MDMSLWPSLIAAGSALLGATIGVFSTLWGERWQARTAELQDRRQAASRLREDRKTAFLRFLAAVGEVERLAELRQKGERIKDADRQEHVSNLWLCQFEIDILCTKPLRDKAREFVKMLAEATWNPPAERTDQYFASTRDAVLDAAHEELDETSSPAV
jgi:hypothetical protein